MNDLFTEYVKKVKEMRDAQKTYFSTKKDNMQTVAADWLKRAKALEKEVDNLTTQLLAGGLQQKLI